VFTVTLDMYSDVPLYRQLADVLRQRIVSGKIPPLSPLPSGKTLVETYGVARGTVEKAIRVLQAEGLVRTVPGRGIFVVPAEER